VRLLIYEDRVKSLLSENVQQGKSVFEINDGKEIPEGRKSDCIIIREVLKKNEDIEGLLESTRKLCQPDSKIVLICTNPVWNLVSGSRKRNWLSKRILENLFYLKGFRVIKHAYYLPLPWDFPLSEGLNSLLERIPVIKEFGYIQLYVLETEKMPKPGNFSVSVVIPCHNEEANIRRCIESVPKFGKMTEIIVVDDGSTDRTSEIVRKILPEKKKLKLVSYQPNMGKGEAVRRGFQEAKGDVLMILDADMTVSPEMLPRFLIPLANGKARFVNGTRMVYPLEEQAMRPLHIVGNHIFSIVFTWLLGQHVSDTLCGTKALFRKDLGAIPLIETSWPDFDLLFGAAKQNFRIVEVPVKYHARSAGKSKMKTFKHGFLLLRMCLKGLKDMKL